VADENEKPEEESLGKWGDIDLDQFFKDNPEAKEELQKRLAVMRDLPNADPFLLAHLAINQAVDFGMELEKSGQTGEEISGRRVLSMTSRLIFSVTLLAKRILMDHPQQLIVDPKQVH
jgi:hypothetical protein